VWERGNEAECFGRGLLKREAAQIIGPARGSKVVSALAAIVPACGGADCIEHGMWRGAGKVDYDGIDMGQNGRDRAQCRAGLVRLGRRSIMGVKPWQRHGRSGSIPDPAACPY
jgi:hypothetical protein